MQVTTKQLCDLISLSILAVMQEKDGTVTNPKSDGPFHWYSPVTTEIGRILGGNQCSCEDAVTLNDHIAAIRLGIKLRNL
ncbi:MAG: hypothetical protein J6S67_18890 [Methanobrevibacter sp.]|nr:hypothetical protein [Methanobrevibacter sp.]